MNVLKSVETTIANLLEGAFGRMFRSEVRPVELARKLTREMDENRTESLSRTYAPNEFAVWLSPQDRARYEEVEDDVIDELCAYLLDAAGVSRRHAEIRPADDGWTIMDLGSTNGILLNGREVRSSQPLHAGDRIALGSTEIVFEVR